MKKVSEKKKLIDNKDMISVDGLWTSSTLRLLSRMNPDKADRTMKASDAAVTESRANSTNGFSFGC